MGGGGNEERDGRKRKKDSQFTLYILHLRQGSKGRGKGAQTYTVAENEDRPRGGRGEPRIRDGDGRGDGIIKSENSRITLWMPSRRAGGLSILYILYIVRAGVGVVQRGGGFERWFWIWHFKGMGVKCFVETVDFLCMDVLFFRGYHLCEHANSQQSAFYRPSPI